MTKLPLQERIRTRLRQLVESKNVSLRVVGEHLKLSPSGVGRILNDEGYTIMWHHVERFCEFFQMTPAELMVEPGALMQPISHFESALLRIIRDMTELERRSLLTILERPVYAAQPKKARLGRAMLTAKEQELVDLFARVKRDGVREGVLKTLRGAAHDTGL